MTNREVRKLQDAIIKCGTCLEDVRKHGMLHGTPGLTYHADILKFFNTHYFTMQDVIHYSDPDTFIEVFSDLLKREGLNRFVDIYVAYVGELVANETDKCWCSECKDNPDDTTDTNDD